MQSIDYEITLQVLMAGCCGGHLLIVALALSVVAQYPSSSLQRTSWHDALHEAARYGNQNIVEAILNREVYDNLPSKVQEGQLSEASKLLPNSTLLAMKTDGEDHSILRHGNICFNRTWGYFWPCQTLRDEQRNTLAEGDDFSHTFITGCASGHKSVLLTVLEKDVRNLLEPQTYRRGLEIASANGHDEVIHFLIRAPSG